MLRARTDNGDSNPPGMVLVPDLIGHADGFQPFRARSARSHVYVDAGTRVQDEAIALVHGRHHRFYLPHPDVTLALDLIELLLARRVDLRVMKPGIYAARLVTDRWTEKTDMMTVTRRDNDPFYSIVLTDVCLLFFFFLNQTLSILTISPSRFLNTFVIKNNFDFLCATVNARVSYSFLVSAS